MSDSFVTFQRYYDLNQINESVEFLKEHSIEYEVENDKLTYDATFAYNELSKEYRLKLRPQDFDRANKILEEVFQKQINSVDKDYYLFEFSDEELFEIIAKPDEWGKLDYVLAQKILKDRGKEVTLQVAEHLKSLRIKDLSQTEPNASLWVGAGYLFAILGGFIGLFIGLMIATHKKTLPNGEKLYAYSEKDRRHGWTIFFIALAIFPFTLLWRYQVIWP